MHPFYSLVCAVVAVRAEDAQHVLVSGTQGYHTFRIPSMVRTASGGLLLFAEGRKYSSSDHDVNDVVLVRSDDNGTTWSDLAVVHGESTASHHVCIGNPSPVAMHNGTVVLLFTRNNTDLGRTVSHDGGRTWSAVAYLDLDLSAAGSGWGPISHLATGPPGGLELRPGGRLAVPATLCRGGTPMKCSGATYGASLALLSDDGGSTWRAGAAVAGGNECQLARAPNGSLVLSMRSFSTPAAPPALGGHRLWSWSADEGQTWTAPTVLASLPDAFAGGSCQSSIARVGGALLLSTPLAPSRSNESVLLSHDSGASWKAWLLVDPGATAYSSLAAIDDHSAALAWEMGGYAAIAFRVLHVPVGV